MRFAQNAVWPMLFGLVTVALVVTLMTNEKASRSATRHALYSQIESDAEGEHKVRKVFQDRIDALEEQVAELEDKLAHCDCP